MEIWRFVGGTAFLYGSEGTIAIKVRRCESVKLGLVRLLWQHGVSRFEFTEGSTITKRAGK